MGNVEIIAVLAQCWVQSRSNKLLYRFDMAFGEGGKGGIYKFIIKECLSPKITLNLLFLRLRKIEKCKVMIF